MERQNLCRSPRGRKRRFILRITIALLSANTYPVCALALQPPNVIIGDTVALGVGIKTVEFDTTHFGEPSLLMGTVQNGNGECFVLRVRTNPLDIADTLCTFQSVPLLVRAGRLDADDYPDLLVSLQMFCPNDSPSYSSVVLHGPDYLMADTLCFRSYLRDAIIDDATHEVWLAYAYDSSWVDSTIAPPWLIGGTFTSGAVLHRTNIESADLQDTTIATRGVLDMVRLDVNGDGESETAAFWQSKSVPWSSVPLEPDGPAVATIGAVVAQEGGSTLLSDTWVRAVQSGYYYGDAQTRLVAPVPVGDLVGAGYLQCVTSFWFITTWPGPTVWGNNGIAVRSLASGDSIWTRPLPSPPDYSPASPSLWDLDEDGVLDVIASQKVATLITDPPPTVNAVWGLKGSTGDSLFYFESPYVLDPVVVGALDDSGVRKAVLVRADTIFVFHLNFTPTGVDDAGGVTPETFTLHQNYPNPFNAQTHIEYEINRPVHVALNVYNILGRYVTTLVDAPQTIGQHNATWNGRDADGIPVSSGVYFYRMKSGDADQARKMLLLK